MLDSTLGGGQLEWRFCDPLRTVVADSNQSKTEYKRETRQRMGRLTDTKVRGFMVTETNNDACAQLQPVPTHASPFAHASLSYGLQSVGGPLS